MPQRSCAKTSATIKSKEIGVTEFLSEKITQRKKKNQKKNNAFMCFSVLLRATIFHFALVTGSGYLSTGQRNVCSADCPARGGCRPGRRRQTPCGCSASLDPPPGSSAPWLAGCRASAATRRAGPCGEENGVESCAAVTLRWIWAVCLISDTGRRDFRRATLLKCVSRSASLRWQLI